MKAIVLFFSKLFGGIWNWIKETAWVQPLLIVGIIFSVIFSIPTVSTWIQDIADDLTSPEAYYRNFQKSLRNEETSDAQKLIDAMMEESDEFGTKFFLVFVDSNCAACKLVQPAIKLLVENTSKYYDASEGGEFKVYTIFKDEEIDNASSSINAKTPFELFLERNDAFFQAVYDAGLASPYFQLNGGIQESDLQKLIDETPVVPTPTLILYDLTENNPSDTAISEVMIGVNGADSTTKAELLTDCWLHRNDFAE